MVLGLAAPLLPLATPVLEGQPKGRVNHSRSYLPSRFSRLSLIVLKRCVTSVLWQPGLIPSVPPLLPISLSKSYPPSVAFPDYS